MARVLSTETRMLDEMQAVERETRLLRLIGPVEWGLAAFFLLLGIVWLFWKGTVQFLAFCAFMFFLCIGHRLKAAENERDKKYRKSGRKGEQKVARLLADKLPDEYVLINDATIKIGRLNAQFDHVAVGPNGVFALETKNWYGHVTGHRGGLYWKICRVGEKARSVRNPYMQIKRQAKVMRAFLRNTPWAGADVHATLVSGIPGTRWEIKDADIPILPVEEAVTYVMDQQTGHRLSPYDIEDLAQQLLKTHEG